MDVVLVLVNVAGSEEGESIAQALVTERLAAAVNVIPGLVSFYRWRGESVRQGEALVVIKTRAARVDAVFARVKALDGYECPAMLAIPVASGDPDYLDWVRAETP